MWKKLLRLLSTLTISTGRKQKSIQDTAQDGESKQSYLQIEREPIKGTPFIMVGSKKDGYCLTIGKHRLTKMVKTKKEVIKTMKAKDWNLLTSIMMAFVYDRQLIDKALSKDTAIPPDEKSQQMALQLNEQNY